MTDHRKNKHEAFAIGVSIVLLSVLMGCSNAGMDSEARSLKSNSKTTTASANQNIAPATPEVTPPIVPISGDSAFDDFKNKTDAEREKIAREAEAQEKDKQRAHEMAMQANEMKADEKKQFSDTLLGLMWMQTQSEMFHPDKCANRKGFISGLKDTAAALKDALATTDAAAAQSQAGASAPNSSAGAPPAAGLPAMTPNIGFGAQNEGANATSGGAPALATESGTPALVSPSDPAPTQSPNGSGSTQTPS